MNAIEIKLHILIYGFSAVCVALQEWDYSSTYIWLITYITFFSEFVSYIYGIDKLFVLQKLLAFSNKINFIPVSAIVISTWNSKKLFHLYYHQ